MIQLSVIISYYKDLANLKLILAALNNQSDPNFEAIISEDDNNVDTIAFVDQQSGNYNFPIIHLNQQVDDGFRKTQMLNKSLKVSNAENIAFIDGDCIPHKHFVKEYISNSESGSFLWGRRVMLGKKISGKVKQKNSVGWINPVSLIFSDASKIKDGIYCPSLQLSYKFRGIKGCNWGIKKQHLIDINGFDEDYKHATVGEDDDIEWRLLRHGLTPKSMKNKANVYHVYHPRTYTPDGTKINVDLMKQKQEQNLIICKNGLTDLR